MIPMPRRAEPCWVDPATGEIVGEGPSAPEGRTDLVALWPDEVSDPQEAAHAESEDLWLGAWYSRKIAELAGAESALEAAVARHRGRIAAQRAWLEARWGGAFHALVDRLLAAQGGPSRSVDLAFGRAGYRKSTRTVVDDEDAALTWACEHAPDAVRVKTSLRIKALPADALVEGKIPGAARVVEDRFYVHPLREDAHEDNRTEEDAS